MESLLTIIISFGILVAFALVNLIKAYLEFCLFWWFSCSIMIAQLTSKFVGVTFVINSQDRRNTLIVIPPDSTGVSAVTYRNNFQ